MVVRRLLIALAVLIALTAVAAGVSPREGPVQDPEPTPSADTLEPAAQVLSAERSGQRVIARQGEWVHFEVRSDSVDTVDVAEIGSEPVEPEVPARFLLLADSPGRYAIELLETRRPIGTLEIR